MGFASVSILRSHVSPAVLPTNKRICPFHTFMGMQKTQTNMAQQTDADDARTEAVNRYVKHIASLPEDVEGRVAPLGTEGVETRQGDERGTLVITVAEELVETHTWAEIKALVRERRADDRDKGWGW